MKRLLLIILTTFVFSAGAYSQVSDSERLGMALDYFQSGKYHEAMLILSELDQNYNLNPRFKAYLGVCYFYEWNYEKACFHLDSLMKKLEVFAPAERAVYYYADAESHFNLKEYEKAIPMYEQMLLVCQDNEKPETLYRLGFCYMFIEEWQNALDNFDSALSYYRRFRNSVDQQSRITQIEKMINGCKEKIEANKPKNINQIITLNGNKPDKTATQIVFDEKKISMQWNDSTTMSNDLINSIVNIFNEDEIATAKISSVSGLFSNLLTIDGINKGDKLAIYDIKGTLKKEAIANGTNFQFDISSFNTGIYLLKINNHIIKFTIK